MRKGVGMRTVFLVIPPAGGAITATFDRVAARLQERDNNMEIVQLSTRDRGARGCPVTLPFDSSIAPLAVVLCDRLVNGHPGVHTGFPYSQAEDGVQLSDDRINWGP